MSVYSVTRRVDDVEVYRYAAAGLIEGDYPFADFDHTLMPDEPQPPSYAGPWTITRLAFRLRFTQSEKVAIEIAALDVPTASMELRAQAAAMRAYLADVSAATFIDLTRADTRAGVLTLEAGGLLAPGRALQILDTPPADSEVWNG